MDGRPPRETATAIRKLLSEEARQPTSPMFKLACHVARPSFNSVSVTVIAVPKASRDKVFSRATEILETFVDAIPAPANAESPEPFSFEIVCAEIPESAE